MRIGIDFDNTIAGYDHLFSAFANEAGLLPPGFTGTKKQVRNAIRRLEDGEHKWRQLQGRVYGAHMPKAELIEGVADFLLGCREKSIPVFIVSHKSMFNDFDPDRINMRDVSTAWMEQKGFFDGNGFGLNRDKVFFESTRKEKIARIAQIGCTHFIDDLAEVFVEEGFPADTRKYLYSPGGGHDNPVPGGTLQVFETWKDITRDILGGPA